MNTVISRSLIIDDDKASNFFNQYVISKHQSFGAVIMMQSGIDAIDYLREIEKDITKKPEVIFLDINMPAMNGWEFLAEFSRLSKSIIKDIKVFILSTSDDPIDLKKSKESDFVYDFFNKPLSLETLDRLIDNHFSFKYAD